jgi:xanthine dehydrogenase YagS FAD-binding subunit
MKAFVNRNPRDLQQAVALLKQARAEGRSAAIVGGGSDLLGMIKEHLVAPDVVVNLKSVRGLDQVTNHDSGVSIGGLATLHSIAAHALLRGRYAALAEAAESVGTPQIRNVGTIAGNVCQRPWCWYLRNGFPCFKNGGDVCYSIAGENQLHAIFGGGPSFIVHPSDTAPALVAFDASFRVLGPGGERKVPAAGFFTLPSADVARENVLGPDEVLTGIDLPPVANGTRSHYYKVLDREAWTHAVVSVAAVLQFDGQVCRQARLVLGGVAPIPWRLPKVEAMLAGQRITPDLAKRAGEAAVEGAQPLQKNAYKLPLTRAVVKRTLLQVAAQT